MKLTRLAGALAATALLVSGCSVATHHTNTPATHFTHTVSPQPADPALGLLSDLHIGLLG